MARKVAGELLLASSEENAELEVRRAAAERQTSHLAHRLRIETAAHNEVKATKLFSLRKKWIRRHRAFAM